MAEQDEKTLPESVLAGMKLASPSAGEEVVISGKINCIKIVFKKLLYIINFTFKGCPENFQIQGM